MKILIYGMGISNKAVKDLCDKINIEYDLDDKGIVYDYIVKSPGIKASDVKAKGKIITDIEFCYMLYKPYIIGITGTNGKTTTTMLINEIIKNNYNTKIGGNIGIPLGSIIDNESVFVLELSSFELDGTNTFKPNIAVLLNITSAHLDYHNNIDNYINAKKKLINNMKTSDVIIYNYDDEVIRHIIKGSKARCKAFSLVSSDTDIYYKDSKIVSSYLTLDCKNLFSNSLTDIADVMAAILVAEEMKIERYKIVDTLETFVKPKYRMERIKDRFINDAKSTNIYSTLSSIKEFENVVLISGGFDRGDSLEPLDMVIPHVRVFYLYGANRFRYEEYLKNKNVVYHLFNNLKDLIPYVIKEEGVILYSPMAPSYDQFNSYEERGKLFEEQIKKAL